jgi:hypothetical protein
MAEWSSNNPDCTGPASVYNPAGDLQRAHSARKARYAAIVLFVFAAQFALLALAARYVPSLLPAPATAAVTK